MLLPVLPLPAAIQDGDTVLLECGRIYSGTLDLRGRREVTVRTQGDCGKAAITPAQPVSGWVRDGQIWTAASDIAPVMLQVGESFVPVAHHPNTPGGWLTGEGMGAALLKVNLPAHKLSGATLVWRPEDWLIVRQTVLSDDRGLLRVASPAEAEASFRDQTPFYLEGQRWMLDSPGEWMHEHGRLYLWPVDGRSPEGRTWVSPEASAIDARGSYRVTIKDIRIFLAERGIDGADTSELFIADTDILNSGQEAIRLGGRGARLENVHVQGTQQQGIRAEDDAQGVSITHCKINDAGMLGMPRRSKGAIVFEQSNGQFIAHNRIVNSAYIGIRVFRNATVMDNEIKGACLRMTDCGGIYTFARDRQPLNTLILRNHISGLLGRLSHAIYLDDFANGVSVIDNRLINNPGGMQLHNAFGNLIRGNAFIASRHEHLLFNETASFAAISNNQISGNRFKSAADNPVYRLWSHRGGAHLPRFMALSHNRYEGTPARFAQLEQTGWVGASDWVRYMDEENPLFSAPRPLPQLARQPQKK